MRGQNPPWRDQYCLRLDLPLSQGQDTQGGLESPREKDPIFSWVGVNGFHQGKRCPVVSAGAGVESEDKGRSCLLGHGIGGAVPEGYPWEVRAKQVVQYSEVGQSFILSRGGGELWKFNQREGEGASEDA